MPPTTFEPPPGSAAMLAGLAKFQEEDANRPEKLIEGIMAAKEAMGDFPNDPAVKKERREVMFQKLQGYDQPALEDLSRIEQERYNAATDIRIFDTIEQGSRRFTANVSVGLSEVGTAAVGIEDFESLGSLLKRGAIPETVAALVGETTGFLMGIPQTLLRKGAGLGGRLGVKAAGKIAGRKRIGTVARLAGIPTAKSAGALGAVVAPFAATGFTAEKIHQAKEIKKPKAQIADQLPEGFLMHRMGEIVDHPGTTIGLLALALGGPAAAKITSKVGGNLLRKVASEAVKVPQVVDSIESSLRGRGTKSITGLITSEGPREDAVQNLAKVASEKLTKATEALKVVETEIAAPEILAGLEGDLRVARFERDKFDQHDFLGFIGKGDKKRADDAIINAEETLREFANRPIDDRAKADVTILKEGIRTARETLQRQGFDPDVALAEQLAAQLIAKRQSIKALRGGDLPQKPLDPEIEAAFIPISQRIVKGIQENVLVRAFSRGDETFASIATFVGKDRTSGLRAWEQLQRAKKTIAQAIDLVIKDRLEFMTVTVDVVPAPGGFGKGVSASIVSPLRKKTRLLTRQEVNRFEEVIEGIPNDGVDPLGNLIKTGTEQPAGILRPRSMTDKEVEFFLPHLENPHIGTLVRSTDDPNFFGRISAVKRTIRVQPVDFETGRIVKVNGKEAPSVDMRRQDLRAASLNENSPGVGTSLPDGRQVGKPVRDLNNPNEFMGFQLTREIDGELTQQRYDALVRDIPEARDIIRQLRAPAASEQIIRDEVFKGLMPPVSFNAMRERFEIQGLGEIIEPLRGYVPSVAAQRTGIGRVIRQMKKVRAAGRRKKTGELREAERARLDVDRGKLDQAFLEADSAFFTAELEAGGEPLAVGLFDAHAQRRAEFLAEEVKNKLLATLLDWASIPLKKGARNADEGFVKLTEIQFGSRGTADAGRTLERVIRSSPEFFGDSIEIKDALEIGKRLVFRGPNDVQVPLRLVKQLNANFSEGIGSFGKEAPGAWKRVDLALGRSMAFASVTSLLTRPSTVIRNITSGAIQLSAKMVEDTIRPFVSLMANLDPKANKGIWDAMFADAISSLPIKLKGAGGRFTHRDIDNQLISRTLAEDLQTTSRQLSELSTGGKINRAVDRTVKVTMAPFNASDLFFKRIIAAQVRTVEARAAFRASGLPKEQASAFYKEHAQTLSGDVNRAILDKTGTYAYNYDNSTPVGLAIQASAVGGTARALVPFAKYPYNHARLMMRYLNPVNLATAADPHVSDAIRIDAVTKLLTAGVMFGGINELVSPRINHVQNRLRAEGKRMGDQRDRREIGVTGRVRVKTIESGEDIQEWWFKMGDVPFAGDVMFLRTAFGVDDGPSPAEFFMDRIGTGPLFTVLMAGMQFKGPFGQYKPASTIAGEGLRTFIPFQPYLELAAKSMDPEQRAYFDRNNSSLENFYNAFADTIPGNFFRGSLPKRRISQGPRKGQEIPLDMQQEFINFLVSNVKQVHAGQRKKLETKALLKIDPRRLEDNPSTLRFLTNSNLEEMMVNTFKRRGGFKKGKMLDALIIQRILRRREDGQLTEEEETRFQKDIDSLRAEEARALPASP